MARASFGLLETSTVVLYLGTGVLRLPEASTGVLCLVRACLDFQRLARVDYGGSTGVLLPACRIASPSRGEHERARIWHGRASP
ncbi:hypothetical protein JCGZ_06361 [Jatropha curcas]|uniref:Uncharacterized protein n=1 Tax=Jatropha curcas TaxID=180498 RepID=A0A067L175_JATCU|nr:hypothetical protein JCGZ_06361 [Jatropha curcas]